VFDRYKNALSTVLYNRELRNNPGPDGPDGVFPDYRAVTARVDVLLQSTDRIARIRCPHRSLAACVPPEINFDANDETGRTIRCTRSTSFRGVKPAAESE